MKAPSTLRSVILWSVISAAFIGPGTVTTAVTAGSEYGLQLLWAVTFATLGCVALQEISARITIAGGITLGESFIKKFGARQGKVIQWLVGGSVVFGCAAYEAGNILGAVAGLNLVTGIRTDVLTVIITLVSGLVLWFGGKNWISNLMMALVLMMGVAFAALAFSQKFTMNELLSSSFMPTLPEGSELIVLGLIGTTIVPYNIFIGAGISKGQTVPLMRIGLAVSIAIGGLITAAILIAGIAISEFKSFPQLAQAMSQQVGPWGAGAVALGLFAAGFSSAITSPYASSLIATHVFGFKTKERTRWVWGAVLLTGFAFGISGVPPIPVILAVQAINGLILPLLTLYLIILVNDTNIVPPKFGQGTAYNIVLLVILFVVTLIGLNNVDKSISATFELRSASHPLYVIIVALAVIGYAAVRVFVKKEDLRRN